MPKGVNPLPSNSAISFVPMPAGRGGVEVYHPGAQVIEAPWNVQIIRKREKIDYWTKSQFEKI